MRQILIIITLTCIIGVASSVYSQPEIRQFPLLEITEPALFEVFDTILAGNRLIHDRLELKLREYLSQVDIDIPEYLKNDIVPNTKYIEVNQYQNQLKVFQLAGFYYIIHLDGVIPYKDHYFLMNNRELNGIYYRNTGKTIGLPYDKNDGMAIIEQEPVWIFNLDETGEFILERFYIPLLHEMTDEE